MDAGIKLDTAMGLDDFASGDTSSSSSSSSRSTRSSGNGLTTDNKPGYAEQCFSDEEAIAPRAIKYQIESFGVRWTTQFSTERIDEGEIVYHSSDSRVFDEGESVAVFTTILSSFDRPEDVDRHDIWVVKWDTEDNEPIDNGLTISPEGTWSEHLHDVLSQYIGNW